MSGHRLSLLETITFTMPAITLATANKCQIFFPEFSLHVAFTMGGGKLGCRSSSIAGPSVTLYRPGRMEQAAQTATTSLGPKPTDYLHVRI